MIFFTTIYFFSEQFFINLFPMSSLLVATPDDDNDDDFTWVFSYGSNSTVQLSGRVENPNLKAYPAVAKGWERIFCIEKTVWGVGGVASIVRTNPEDSSDGTQCQVYGAAIRLSPVELSKLDGFECPVYGRIELDIEVAHEPNKNVFSSVHAVVYRNKSPLWRGPPSQQYLTAIHLMLREQWATLCPQALTIRICGLVEVGPGVDKLKLVVFQCWNHPGVPCLTLSALCVEVNCRRCMANEQAWVMPRTINEIRSKLDKVGVESSAQLAMFVGTEAGRKRLNLLLREAGQLEFTPKTLLIFAELLVLKLTS